jgi:hypothetical protein
VDNCRSGEIRPVTILEGDITERPTSLEDPDRLMLSTDIEKILSITALAIEIPVSLPI